MQTVALCFLFIFMSLICYAVPWKFFIQHFDRARLDRPMVKLLLGILINYAVIIVVGVDAARYEEVPTVMTVYLALVCTPIVVYGLLRLVAWISNAGKLSQTARGIVFTLALVIPPTTLLLVNLFGLFSLTD